MAATVPVEQAGQSSPLLDAAASIGDAFRTSTSTSTGTGTGRQDQLAETPPARPEPQPGSYERFMSTFGNPTRWAGR